MADADWLSCAQTASLVRAALKRRFLGARFSVRSKTYAGGASIDVSWTDGPPRRDVEVVAGAYAGADFDGSIDLMCSRTHWLNPDGTAQLAHDQGTAGSRGALPERFGSRSHPDARLVRFGADFVLCQRDYSEAFRAWVSEELRRQYGDDVGGRSANDRLYRLAEESWWPPSAGDDAGA
jgi:hypothetical protein